MNLSIKPNLNPILVEGEVAQDATTGRYFVGDGKTPLTELKPRDDIMIRKYCESAKIALQELSADILVLVNHGLIKTPI